MADPRRPGETGKTGPGNEARAGLTDDELASRGRALEDALSARRPRQQADERSAPVGGMAGFGQALRLSSEFIAGIAVGAMLGWLIDRFAGTSPWGLIVFLLLGFVAGVLNVLRSAGLVAEVGPKAKNDADGSEQK